MQKKVHRFYIEFLPDEEAITVTNKDVIHHLRDVLKLAPGEHIRLFASGGPEIEVSIISLTKNELVVKKEKEIPISQPPRKIIAVVSIVKRDLFEFVVQKLTEIGVREIVPLLAARTVKQSVRIDRLQTISDEALEQCGAVDRVTIHEPLPLKEVLGTFPGKSIVFDTGAHTPLSEHTDSDLLYYIGPEGGWSDEERALFKEHDVQTASLGDRILRAETAAIVAADRLLWK